MLVAHAAGSSPAMSAKSSARATAHGAVETRLSGAERQLLDEWLDRLAGG